MEAGEENGGNVNMKRQRAPLSDSEDNILSGPDENDGQKRRRLEAGGQENRSPKPSTSGRLAELEAKPDTPMVPSVRSRVQQLTQRREGAAPLVPRCSSDPGGDSLSLIIPDKGFRECLLGENEFNQRMERFKRPVLPTSPAPMQSPANPGLRTRSNFVSGIQEKLQGSTTPSSKQASRIRQERNQELNQLPFQPISENAWLKRSNSDPSLTQQVHGDAEMKDDSFTEAPASGAETPPVNTTGERAPGVSGAPAASEERESSSQGQQPNTDSGEAVREDKASADTPTVLKLPFSEDHGFSKAPVSEAQNVSESPAAEQSLSESTFADESNVKETREATERVPSEVFTSEEDEKMDDSSCGDEALEPSTEEELKMWRYPQGKVLKDEEQEVWTDERVESFGDSPAKTAGLSELQEDETHRSEEDESESESCVDESVKDQSTSDRDQGNMTCERAPTGDASTTKPELKDTEGRPREDEESKTSQSVSRNEDTDLKSDSRVMQTEASPRALKETQTGYADLERNTEAVPVVHDKNTDGSDEIQASDHPEMVRESADERQRPVGEETHKAESSKKVTFILEPELINSSTLSENDTSMGSRAESSLSDADLSCHADETNTGDIIDQMFEEVLEYAGRIEEERRDDEDNAGERDSGIGACSGDKDKMDTELEKSEEEGSEENRKLESNGDELLTFPPSGILSPLSKSVEAVVTPLRLAATQESSPSSFLLTPEETSTPPAESAPLYSIDAYRTQRLSKLPAIQSVSPGVQRRAPETSKPQPPVNTKEKIAALNEEAGKLQTVINQTLQALSCCTDEEHGRGSLEEAEAEKLLLVSCEKRSALLAEVARLREERGSESGETSGEDREYMSQQPCRGTVGITNIQLPLKVEFVCSSQNRAGRPSHYFFVLIRYGPCNIIATPLATAADAQNGDTISFATSVTLKDIRSFFEIDVEVYSLSHTSGSSCSMDRTATKSRVTPRKLLNTITRSSHILTAAALPALNTRRSSNFCLVGSHKITLASLGHSKFPLDKMKLEGKIRRLLGDEFQEKVPFLSPLEGNIYLQLDSTSHSNVQHQGFLTMFELISGYGVWHRRYFVLEGCTMNYWNHPNDKETKEAEGSISLSSSPSQCVRPVKRDSCARPFTFELVSNVPQQQQQDHSQEALAKCWFSADTKQERLDWMERLNQALLDFHTWNRAHAGSQQPNTSSSESLRESIL